MKTLAALSFLMLSLGSTMSFASAEECVAAVRGEYPYPGAAEAYGACMGVNMECVKAVRAEYPYPNTTDAAKSCRRVNMECVKAVRSEYPYPNTADAAKKCSRADEDEEND